MDLSIVIPAFNEEGKIGSDIRAAAKFLRDENFDGEIIVVDDGSTDGTVEEARAITVSSRLQIVENRTRRGKGYSVKQGIIRSSGKIVMFADSGLCVPFEEAMKGVDLIRQKNCDLAYGSRVLKASRIIRNKSIVRRIISTLFRNFVPFFMGTPRHLTDTQCGFKVYRGDAARSIYSESATDGFMFDVEIILLAVRKDFRILEFPIQWTCDRDSRLRPGSEFLSYLKELSEIRKRA